MKLRSSEAVMVLSTSYIPHLNTALVPLERKGPTENNINSNTNTILIILLILILILHNTDTMDNLYCLFFVFVFCFVFLFFESSLTLNGRKQGRDADLGLRLSHEIRTTTAVFKDLMLPHELHLMLEQHQLGLPTKKNM